MKKLLSTISILIISSILSIACKPIEKNNDLYYLVIKLDSIIDMLELSFMLSAENKKYDFYEKRVKKEILTFQKGNAEIKLIVRNINVFQKLIYNKEMGAVVKKEELRKFLKKRNLYIPSKLSQNASLDALALSNGFKKYLDGEREKIRNLILTQRN